MRGESDARVELIYQPSVTYDFGASFPIFSARNTEWRESTRVLENVKAAFFVFVATARQPGLR